MARALRRASRWWTVGGGGEVAFGWEREGCSSEGRVWASGWEARLALKHVPRLHQSTLETCCWPCSPLLLLLLSLPFPSPLLLCCPSPHFPYSPRNHPACKDPAAKLCGLRVTRSPRPQAVKGTLVRDDGGAVSANIELKKSVMKVTQPSPRLLQSPALLMPPASPRSTSQASSTTRGAPRSRSRTAQSSRA